MYGFKHFAISSHQKSADYTQIYAYVKAANIEAHNS